MTAKTDDKAPAPATEGWGDLNPNDASSHYYRNGNALCGARTLYGGDLTADGAERDHSEDCGRCAFKLTIIGAPEPVQDPDAELRAFNAAQERADDPELSSDENKPANRGRRKAKAEGE